MRSVNRSLIRSGYTNGTSQSHQIVKQPEVSNTFKVTAQYPTRDQYINSVLEQGYFKTSDLYESREEYIATQLRVHLDEPESQRPTTDYWHQQWNKSAAEEAGKEYDRQQNESSTSSPRLNSHTVHQEQLARTKVERQAKLVLHKPQRLMRSDVRYVYLTRSYTSKGSCWFTKHPDGNNRSFSITKYGFDNAKQKAEQHARDILMAKKHLVPDS